MSGHNDSRRPILAEGCSTDGGGGSQASAPVGCLARAHMSSRRYKKIPVGIFNEALDGLSLAARGLYVSLFTDERMRPCGVFRFRPGELDSIPSHLWAELSAVVVLKDRWVWMPDHALSQGAGPKWDAAVKGSTLEVSSDVWFLLGAEASPAIPYRYRTDTVPMGLPSVAVAVSVSGAVSVSVSGNREQEQEQGASGKEPSEEPSAAQATENQALPGKGTTGTAKAVETMERQLAALDAAIARYDADRSLAVPGLREMAVSERATVLARLAAAGVLL